MPQDIRWNCMVLKFISDTWKIQSAGNGNKRNRSNFINAETESTFLEISYEA